jgi:hypothetical protein
MPEEGIDLSILTSVVKPWQQVDEHDVHWDYQTLTIEVAHAIRSEKDELERDDEIQDSIKLAKEFI